MPVNVQDYGAVLIVVLAWVALRRSRTTEYQNSGNANSLSEIEGKKLQSLEFFKHLVALGKTM